MAEINGLREAFNLVSITGKLVEKNMEKKVASDGSNYISGNLVIEYGENKRVKVGFYSKEYKKNTTEISKIYKGLETILNEYVSAVEAITKGLPDTEISTVSIKGKFAPYDAVSKKTGNLIYYPTIKANFAERVAPDSKYEAVFSTEMYIENIEAETKNDILTGRTLVSGEIPIFGGQIMPITFYCSTDEEKCGGDVGKYITDHYEVGKTVQVNGEIDCTIEHKEYTKEGMFGSTVQTFDSVSNEFIITGGLPNCYLITDPKHYDKNTIKAAMLAREEYLESLKNKNTNSSTTPSANIGFTASAGFGNAPSISDDDLRNIDF